MRRNRVAAAGPTVITSASTSLDDQHDARRRKYLTMMGIRILCVIAAVIVAQFSLWLALAFMVGGAVLPWCAVLIANDRPPQRSTAFVRYRPPTADAIAPAPSRPPASPDDAQPSRSAPSRNTVYVVDSEPIAPAAEPNGRRSTS